VTREIVSTSKQDWATPQWLFDVLHEEHNYEVDLFAAWYNAKLPRFFGPGSEVAEDALNFNWAIAGARGFANPEYGRIEACMQRGIAMCGEGFFSTWLVPANTDTVWFHKYAYLGQIDFFQGRISFEDQTPADIEAARMCALIEKRLQKSAKAPVKDVQKLASILFEVDEDSLAKNDTFVYATSLLDGIAPSWRELEMKDRKKPGPGFPSMLVHFDPASPACFKPPRRRSAKTGKLL
jgi:phage N-6-adenine-methyltransferase